MAIFQRFIPQNLSNAQCEYIERILRKFLLGIFICRESGGILYSWQLDPNLRVELFSSFISALNLFGEENVGKIKRILIEGLDIEISVQAKHDLILIAFFKPDMVKDYLEEESQRGLDIFYDLYSSYIQSNRTNRNLYQEFDEIMWQLVQTYLIRIELLDPIIDESLIRVMSHNIIETD